jgi:hypothetical protein
MFQCVTLIEKYVKDILKQMGGLTSGELFQIHNIHNTKQHDYSRRLYYKQTLLSQSIVYALSTLIGQRLTAPSSFVGGPEFFQR